MTDPTVLTMATQDDLNRGAFSKIVNTYLRSNDPAYLDTRLAAASQAVEEMCGGRRFMPFTITETPIAEGVNPDQGDWGAGLRPLGSFAADTDYGRPTMADQVRDLWVDQVPPTRQDLWTYSNVAITVRPLWGGALTLTPGMFRGPDETGHILLNLGVICPQGSQVEITYSGGYTVAYPATLVEATRLECVRKLLLELDPGQASHIDEDRLTADIFNMLLPFGAGRSGR